jgi:hypothetical protein
MMKEEREMRRQCHLLSTKRVVFVPPFEKDLLRRLNPGLEFIHSTVHEECMN